MNMLSRAVVVTFIAAAMTGRPMNTNAANDIKALAEGNTGFAMDLYAWLRACSEL